jgi:Uma2 family endonuclease
MSTKPLALKDIIYPESDGKPVAETDEHRDLMFDLIAVLRFLFKGQRVYVSGNLLVYYIEGNPKKSVAPDTFVVKDCDPRRRRIFKIWEERKGPNFAMELTSKKTRREDERFKKDLYAQLRVPEYFLFDPFGEWLKPPLVGYRLVNGEYMRIQPNADGGLESQQLGVTFKIEGGRLVLYRTDTGKRLLSEAEWLAAQAQAKAADAETRAAQAEARAAKEAVVRQALEQELARLREQRQTKKRRKG